MDGVDTLLEAEQHASAAKNENSEKGARGGCCLLSFEENPPND